MKFALLPLLLLSCNFSLSKQSILGHIPCFFGNPFEFPCQSKFPREHIISRFRAFPKSILPHILMTDNDGTPRILWSKRLAKIFQNFRAKSQSMQSENRILGSRRLANILEKASAGKKTAFANPLVSEILRSPIPPSRNESPKWRGVKLDRPTLPDLSEQDLSLLVQGERLQFQKRDGRLGNGLVVQDIRASTSTVFNVLADIDRYCERIPTVREAQIYQREPAPSVPRTDGHIGWGSHGDRYKASFKVSKFRLEICAELLVIPGLPVRIDGRAASAAKAGGGGGVVRFRIDPDRPAPILEQAEGFWLVEPASGRESGWTRVWLSADIACSPLLPTPLIDYAACRALPRASAWLQPAVERLNGSTSGDIL